MRRLEEWQFMNTKCKSVFQKVILTLSAFALMVVPPAEAAPKKKMMKNSAIAEYEGEYSVDHNQVRKTKQKKKSKKLQAKKSSSKGKKYSARTTRDRTAKSRAPASVGKKKNSTKKVTKRKPASVSKSKHAKKKKTAKKRQSRVSKRHDPKRLPYAKETRHERDMPFISVPTTKVRSKNTRVVMEDPEAYPGETPQAAPAAIDTRFDDTAVTESTPPMETPPLVDSARAPASAATTQMEPEVYGPPMREPDAFDLHSGSDPMSH